mmetsp:Transcript_98071/g.280629  ORF Transcript_98071/g.280629 Transcript_98071/m.280629 type:complete len:212 (-) Transcript_98071:208-843(-)
MVRWRPRRARGRAGARARGRRERLCESVEREEGRGVQPCCDGEVAILRRGHRRARAAFIVPPTVDDYLMRMVLLAQPVVKISDILLFAEVGKVAGVYEDIAGRDVDVTVAPVRVAHAHESQAERGRGDGRALPSSSSSTARRAKRQDDGHRHKGGRRDGVRQIRQRHGVGRLRVGCHWRYCTPELPRIVGQRPMEGGGGSQACRAPVVAVL